MDTTRDLFEHELRDIYDAENKLLNALETMAKKVSNEQLSKSFAEHREITQGQTKRLEQVFKLIDRAPRREPCKGINGLIEEFSGFVKDESPAAPILDLFATAAASKVEAYEICAYKSLIRLADKLGIPDAAELFEESLREEQEAALELEALADKVGQDAP